MQQKLTPAEFDAHVANHTLRLAFIGMSNGGKSYRSRKLQQDMGFLWYQVDEQIQKALGLTTMGELAAWVGYPTDPQYPEREKTYLQYENEFTRHASMQTGGKNLVFDTTGSVVHLEPETIRSLQDNCLIVHLDVGVQSIGPMVEQFFREPKPVAWCGALNKGAGESNDEALRRCYPALLTKRLAQYGELAHVTI